MRYRIERTDRVRFTSPVREHHLEVRAAPWDDAGQRLIRLDVTADPAAVFASHRDCFGNQVHRTALLGAHDAIAVQMVAEVEALLTNPFDLDPVAPAREPDWIADSLRQAPRLWDLVLHRSPLTPDLSAASSAAALALPQWQPGAALIAQVQEAMAWVRDGFEHDPDAAPAANLDALFEARAGSDADLAHLLVAMVRGWEVPARFVTGYLDPAYFEPDDDEPDAEPRPQVLRCWTEVLIPGGGWRGFDPSLGLLADATYIRLAVGRDARDVTGFRQGFKGDGKLGCLDTSISVTRLD